MTYRGTVKGKTIEIEERLPYPEGQRVHVVVEPAEAPTGSPSAILEAVHAPPHLSPEDIDELKRSIEEAKLPVRDQGPFDHWK